MMPLGSQSPFPYHMGIPLPHGIVQLFTWDSLTYWQGGGGFVFNRNAFSLSIMSVNFWTGKVGNPFPSRFIVNLKSFRGLALYSSRIPKVKKNHVVIGLCIVNLHWSWKATMEYRDQCIKVNGGTSW